MIDDMFTEEEKQAALDQAYRFLAQRFLSSYELRQKDETKTDFIGSHRLRRRAINLL